MLAAANLAGFDAHDVSASWRPTRQDPRQTPVSARAIPSFSNENFLETERFANHFGRDGFAFPYFALGDCARACLPNELLRFPRSRFRTPAFPRIAVNQVVCNDSSVNSICSPRGQTVVTWSAGESGEALRGIWDLPPRLLVTMLE